MPIPADETTYSEPSTVTATYDKWGISDLRVIGSGCVAAGEPGPAVPVRVTAEVVKYRLRPDGQAEASPLPGDVRRVSSDDIYALAAVDADVATALGALVGAVAKLMAVQYAPQPDPVPEQG